MGSSSGSGSAALAVPADHAHRPTSYALLSAKDVPRYMGCKILRKNAVSCIVGSQSLPRQLHELASREELGAWLTRILLFTILPAKSRPPPTTMGLPHNLIAFCGLLLHLHRVGFPGHWLSDFLRIVTSGRLATDISPYRGLLPMSISDTRKRGKLRQVRLDPWLLDFENVIAIVNPGFPFPVPKFTDFATEVSEIGTFEAVVRPSRIDYEMAMFGFLDYWITPFDPVVHLLFYKAAGQTAAKVVEALPAILEDQSDVPRGHVFVLTSVEEIDCRKLVRWRMSKKRAARMQLEQWRMVAFRSDTLQLGESCVLTFRDLK